MVHAGDMTDRARIGCTWSTEGGPDPHVYNEFGCGVLAEPKG